MIINADNLNKLRDAIISIQRYYMQDVQQYLVEIIKYKGPWASNVRYTKYDVITYDTNGATESFMGIQTNIPLGTSPLNKDYFIPLTLRGEQGASGTGMSPRGYWNAAVQYYKHDCVAYNNVLWYAKQDNLNRVPQPISDDWEQVMSLSQQIVISDTEPLGQNKDDVWYQRIT